VELGGTPGNGFIALLVNLREGFADIVT